MFLICVSPDVETKPTTMNMTMYKYSFTSRSATVKKKCAVKVLAKYFAKLLIMQSSFQRLFNIYFIIVSLILHQGIWRLD